MGGGAWDTRLSCRLDWTGSGYSPAAGCSSYTFISVRNFLSSWTTTRNSPKKWVINNVGKLIYPIYGLGIQKTPQCWRLRERWRLWQKKTSMTSNYRQREINHTVHERQTATRKNNSHLKIKVKARTEWQVDTVNRNLRTLEAGAVLPFIRETDGFRVTTAYRANGVASHIPHVLPLTGWLSS